MNIPPVTADILPLCISELVDAMQCMPVGVTIIDSALTLRFWNDAFCRLLDLSDEVMRPGVTLQELFYFNARRGEFGPGNPDDQVEERIRLSRLFRPHHFTRTRPNGTVLDITGRVIQSADGGAFGFVTIYQNVTLEHQHEQHLLAANKELQVAYDDLKLAQIGYAAMEEDRRRYYQMAVRDPLTGLFTRYYMEDAAARLIELHERNQSTLLALLAFDIDHFKGINDTYGHLSGDIVLCQVGALLSQLSRRTDVGVRFGGDEFAVFQPGVNDKECMAFAERFRAAINAIQFDGNLSELKLTISVGVAEHRIGESLTDLLSRADTALYEAKRGGRNCARKAP
ncbi:diguanylate cyclase [Duganella sp. BJB488]|uniref:GGDEF domain-containing protein n=1 Tax=unclassified Duganella TaxID=2636909 RepID=UPI000E3543C4|nr:MULTISPECIES: diguanylate cyclase [unclassified Duganella]RFP10957.1 diguanylate cyclase [Duganella sp. BJB489]RFP14494.1 diguanylate cyclase [Duganella sp. BJB488]RFP30430.1 diguanylate cyclase [Duganella sp. BJB480]